MNDSLKDRIAQYELLEIIGDGGQGKVFKARCVEAADGPVAPGEVVALKVLRVPPDDDQARTRFEAQAEILKRLVNPHIIRYRDSFIWHSGEWDEAQCLVMEYLDGETLASRLDAARRGLPWPEVKNIFEQCLDGLISAAKQGVIHRDLKPSNIFLTRDGSVRVFDFDIARIEGESQRSTQGWKGSFDYMAPDFITESDFHGDELSDIFSLGTCVCQALTGKLPFESFGDNAHIGYLNRWRNASTPPALSFRPGAYRVLANARSFVSRSLSTRRDKRYSSFTEMLADLQRIRRRVIQHRGKDAYELRELLGRGGFGEVFEGVRLGDGRSVAIKHLFADRQSARFIKEAKMLRRYSHPFLVQYVDFIEVASATQEKQYFLILELLAGMPDAGLRNRIKREGKLNPSEVIPLFLNYLEAMSFLHCHAHPLIHRDIKPMNLYAPAGHPEKAKVFDLGVSRDVSGTVTSGGIPGTLDYMAPEFAAAGADRGSPQTDIYSLGLCLYESLVGQTAYSRLPSDINSAWPMFLERALTGPEADFRARVFRMYPDLKGVVRKAIDFQPGARYASAAAMRQDLEKVLCRLDRPEEILPLEEPTTAAAGVPLSSNSAPSEKHRRSSASEQGQPVVPENVELSSADLPEMELADYADVAFRNRRRRAVRAALVILALLAAGTGATIWWSGSNGGSQPADVSTVVPVPRPPAQLVTVLSVPAVVPEIQPVAPASVESAAVKAARKELALLVRSVRIPVADPAYLERLSTALTRARLLGGQYPELADETDRGEQEMEQHGRDLPALFQSGLAMVLAQKDSQKAATLLAAWRSARPQAALMGLTAEQADAQASAMEKILGRFKLAAATTEIKRLIPRQITEDRDLEQAEQAAKALAAIPSRNWPGVAAGEKQAAIAALHSMLTARLQAGLAAWRDEAVSLYQIGQDGANRHAAAALASFPDNAPSALALVNDDYLAVMKTVDTARADWGLLVRRRRAVLQAIEMGASEVDREALAALPVDPQRVLDTAAAARQVRVGFNTLALLDATEPARVFLGTVGDCWKKAERCEGPLGGAIRDAAWAAIHAQLAEQGAILLQLRKMMMAGVRTPEQQARVRREYLRLLAQVETITGRVAGCPEDDLLRVQANRFFQRPFLHRSLLENPSFANNIPWLAEEFRKAQTP